MRVFIPLCIAAVASVRAEINHPTSSPWTAEDKAALANVIELVKKYGYPHNEKDRPTNIQAQPSAVAETTMAVDEQKDLGSNNDQMKPWWGYLFPSSEDSLPTPIPGAPWWSGFLSNPEKARVSEHIKAALHSATSGDGTTKEPVSNLAQRMPEVYPAHQDVSNNDNDNNNNNIVPVAEKETAVMVDPVVDISNERPLMEEGGDSVVAGEVGLDNLVQQAPTTNNNINELTDRNIVEMNPLTSQALSSLSSLYRAHTAGGGWDESAYTPLRQTPSTEEEQRAYEAQILKERFANEAAANFFPDWRQGSLSRRPDDKFLCALWGINCRRALEEEVPKPSLSGAFLERTAPKSRMFEARPESRMFEARPESRMFEARPETGYLSHPHMPLEEARSIQASLDLMGAASISNQNPVSAMPLDSMSQWASPRNAPRLRGSN